MKNRYNPYTVPENFFEDSCQKAVIGFKRRRRIVFGAVTTMAVAMVVVMSTVLADRINSTAVQEEVVASNLAQMYEYDIFLQVNF